MKQVTSIAGAVLAAFALVACVSSSERMRGDVGKPIAEPIIRNGPPESVVRLDAQHKAYTFVKRDFVRRGSRISPDECRYTLTVHAPRDGMAESEMIVVGYRPPPSDCE